MQILILSAFLTLFMFIGHALPINGTYLEPLAVKHWYGWVLLFLYYTGFVNIGLIVARAIDKARTK